MNKKPNRDNRNSGRGRNSDGDGDKRGSDRNRGGSGFSKRGDKDGRGGYTKSFSKSTRGGDSSKRRDDGPSKRYGRDEGDSRPNKYESRDNRRSGDRDDRGPQKRYGSDNRESRFPKSDSRDDRGRNDRRSDDRNRDDRGRGDFRRDDRRGDDRNREDRGRDFRGSRDDKRPFERGDNRDGSKSRFDKSDSRGGRGEYDKGSSSSNDRRGSSDRNDRPNKYGRENSRDNRRSSDRDDRRSNPDLKKTRNYRSKDNEIIGNWRDDLPEERKNNRSKPSKERHAEPRIIDEEIRLNRFIANSGLCSRREADEFIVNGSVTVNGVVVKELGVRVQPGDEIRFKGRQVLPEKAVYILMNKPKDCITSLDDPDGRKTVMDVLENEVPERVFPVGRLDRNTTGVLLLTNDGDLSQKLTHPSFGVHKVYRAELNKALTKADMDSFLKGVELEDGTVNFDEIAYLDDSKSIVGVEIHSGKNRVIHRMFNSLGYLVDKLDRVSFAGLTKDKVKRGEFRYLTEKEVRLLFKESGKKMA